MESKRWHVPKPMVALLVAAAIAAPAVIAQTPSSNAQAGVAVQQTTAIDAAGNTVVTERTFINGRLAKQEVTVTSPAGRPVSKIETVFNAAGQTVRREVVMVNAGTVTRIEQKFVNGQLVREEIKTAAANHGRLNQIREEQKIEKVEQTARDKDEMEPAENERQEHQGGGDGHGR